MALEVASLLSFPQLDSCRDPELRDRIQEKLRALKGNDKKEEIEEQDTFECGAEKGADINANVFPGRDTDDRRSSTGSLTRRTRSTEKGGHMSPQEQDLTALEAMLEGEEDYLKRRQIRTAVREVKSVIKESRAADYSTETVLLLKEAGKVGVDRREEETAGIVLKDFETSQGNEKKHVRTKVTVGRTLSDKDIISTDTTVESTGSTADGLEFRRRRKHVSNFRMSLGGHGYLQEQDIDTTEQETEDGEKVVHTNIQQETDVLSPSGNKSFEQKTTSLSFKKQSSILEKEDVPVPTSQAVTAGNLKKTEQQKPEGDNSINQAHLLDNTQRLLSAADNAVSPVLPKPANNVISEVEGNNKQDELNKNKQFTNIDCTTGKAVESQSVKKEDVIENYRAAQINKSEPKSVYTSKAVLSLLKSAKSTEKFTKPSLEVVTPVVESEVAVEPFQVLRAVSQQPSNSEVTQTAVCPGFVRCLQDVSLANGDPLQLEVVTSGEPIPIVQWFCNGVELAKRTDCVVTQADNSCSLRVDKCSKSHEGRYSALALNDCGRSETVASVTVKEKGRVKPIVVEGLLDCAVTDGDDAVFAVQLAKNDLVPSVIWKLNGKVLKPSEDFKQAFKNEVATLTIVQILLDDAGELVCEVSNEAGREKTCCQVKVKEQDLSRKHSPPAVIASSPSVAQPKFTKPLADVSTCFGQRAELICNVTGNPAPTVRWFLGKNEIPRFSRELRVIGRAGGEQRLEIQRVQNSHQGRVRVVASNSQGEAECSCTLTVRAAENDFSKMISSRNSFRLKAEDKKGVVRVSSLISARRPSNKDSNNNIDGIDDEQLLNNMLSECTELERRQKIRARLRDLRDTRRRDLELQRSKSVREPSSRRITASPPMSNNADLQEVKAKVASSSSRTAASEATAPISGAAAGEELNVQMERATRPGASGTLQVTSRTWSTKDGGSHVISTRSWGNQQPQDNKTSSTSPAPSSSSKSMGAIAALAAEGVKRYGGNTQTWRPRVQQRRKDSDSDSDGEVKYKDTPASGTASIARSRTFHAAARPASLQPQKPVTSSGSFRAPGGPGQARALFEKRDQAANPERTRPNFLSTLSTVKKAANRMHSAVEIKHALLRFVQMNIEEYENVEITNFSTSWNDGMAFCALIHHFYPESFDFSALDPSQRRHNFELAFDTAEKCGDIAPLLDVEDMVRMKKPDWKCVFTYVQSIYRHLRKHPRAVGTSHEE